MFMRRRYLCPFCFTEHAFDDVEFECQSRARCRTEPDEQMARYLGTPSATGYHHFRSTASSRFGSAMPDAAECDLCHQVSRVRVCPACHNLLPSDIDTAEPMIISLIGTRGVGKSTYVGVLIHEMMKRLVRPFGATFTLPTALDQRQYRERFEEPLYNYGQPIGQTHSYENLTTIEEKRPILATLTKTERFGRLRTFTLVFFDSAGEDWQNPDIIASVARYVSHSAGIIFLLDPLNNRTVLGSITNRAAIASSVGDGYDPAADPATVIGNVATLIRQQQGLRNNQRIAIPVAASFSKLDVLEDMGFVRGSTLSRPSPHALEGSFDENDSKLVDGEMRGLLEQWGNGDFLAFLDQNYATNRCFAFSAYGRRPDTDSQGRIPVPVPKRIEDAMFWLLHLNKVL